MIIANANNAKIQRRWSEGHGSQESSGPLIYRHVTTLIWKNNLDNNFFWWNELYEIFVLVRWWGTGAHYSPSLSNIWQYGASSSLACWPPPVLSVSRHSWVGSTTVRAGQAEELCVLWLGLVKIVFISNSQKIESLFVYLTLNWTESICWNAKCLIT